MEEKKKKKLKTWHKVLIWTGVTFVVIKGVTYLIDKKYSSLNSEENIGNLLKSGEAIEMEPGRKMTIPSSKFLTIVSRDERKLKGIVLSQKAFKDGVKVKDLESVTGNYNFNLREGQKLVYNMVQPIGKLQAIFGKIKAKALTGFIEINGKFEE